MNLFKRKTETISPVPPNKCFTPIFLLNSNNIIISVKNMNKFNIIFIMKIVIIFNFKISQTFNLLISFTIISVLLVDYLKIKFHLNFNFFKVIIMIYQSCIFIHKVSYFTILFLLFFLPPIFCYTSFSISTDLYF